MPAEAPMTLAARVTVPRPTTVDVDLRVDGGETLALLGPNGAGKSSIIEAIAGVVESSSTITLDGSRIDALPPRDRRIGVVFQDLSLFPRATALENVAFAARWSGATRGRSRTQAEELLRRMDVAHRANALPAELSGGESQRVALARALARRPALLLLDEPLSALDLQGRAEIRSLLREVLRSFGGPGIVVTHDPVDAATLAHRIAVIERGRVTQTGSVEQIRGDPRSRYAAEFAGVNLFAGRLDAIEAGVGALRTTEGDVIVSIPADFAGSSAIGVLRPADVSISVRVPETSARNVLRGMVAGISIETDRARVRIASAPPVSADVTLGSLERLGLRPGVEVWATFKATEVRLTPGA